MAKKIEPEVNLIRWSPNCTCIKLGMVITLFHVCYSAAKINIIAKSGDYRYVKDAELF